MNKPHEERLSGWAGSASSEGSAHHGTDLPQYVLRVHFDPAPNYLALGHPVWGQPRGKNPRSALEDVLHLLEGVRREDVGHPQVRRARVLARMEGIAQYEDRRSGLYGQLLGPDPDQPAPL